MQLQHFFLLLLCFRLFLYLFFPLLRCFRFHFSSWNNCSRLRLALTCRCFVFIRLLWCNWFHDCRWFGLFTVFYSFRCNCSDCCCGLAILCWNNNFLCFSWLRRHWWRCGFSNSFRSRFNRCCSCFHSHCIFFVCLDFLCHWRSDENFIFFQFKIFCRRSYFFQFIRLLFFNLLCLLFLSQLSLSFDNRITFIIIIFIIITFACHLLLLLLLFFTLPIQPNLIILLIFLLLLLHLLLRFAYMIIHF